MTHKELEKSFDKFVTKYLGKKADFDGAYAGQCVDLFRFFNKEVLEIPQPKGVVGAKDFWTNYETDPILKKNFTKIANTPTAVPIKGDVMIWGAWKNIAGLPDNKFGHISMFIEGDVSEFTSFDQNYPTLSKCTKTKHNYMKPKVLGWLRPKTSVPDPIDPCGALQIKYNELRERWVARDIEFDELKEKLKVLEKEKKETPVESPVVTPVPAQDFKMKLVDDLSPETKKSLIEARRTFIAAALTQLGIIAPNWDVFMGFIGDDPKKLLYTLVIPVVTAGLKGLLKYVQEKYGEGIYSRWMYKI